MLELLTFVLEGAAAIPDASLDAADRADRAARPERYERARLLAERDRLLALAERYTTDAPRIWAPEEGDDEA